MSLSILAIASALLSLAAEPSSTLQRQRHDDTIYIVRGTADQLTRFQNDVGLHWEGGTLLTKDEGKGLYRYWAYPDRTAPQSREFIFGAMMSGLLLDIIPYDERLPFRAERSALDEIAVRCGFAVDPFFITPLGELRMAPQPDVSQQTVDCVLSAIKASEALRKLPMGFVGNAAVPEKAN